jgi:cbb3-type cytochrome oxidase subunit 3
VASEVAQFVGMMVLLLGILVGSYWFVYSPTRREERQERERQEGSRD